MQPDPVPDYQIGYKKPPEDGRFKKGQSGNPRGRPAGSKNFTTVLRQVMTAETITVTENGRRRRLSKTEIMSKQLVNRAAHGEPRAIQAVLRLISEYGIPEPKDREQEILAELGYLYLRFQEGREPELTKPGSEHTIGGKAPPESASTLFWNALYERITITENGRRHRVSTLEAMLRQLANRASEGDPTATRTMLRLLSEAERREAESAQDPKAARNVVVVLPHNYRAPIEPRRLTLQKELSALWDAKRAKKARSGTCQ